MQRARPGFGPCSLASPLHLVNRWAANIFKLFSGKVSGQVVVVLTMPALTRLFLPEHWGLIQLFETIAALFAALTCLKYELSIPLARTPREAEASVALSSLIAATMSSLSVLVVLVGRTDLAQWFHAPALADLLWFLPPFVLLTGMGNILNYWAAREGYFGTMALADVSLSLCDRASTIGIGVLVRGSALGLFGGRILGLTANVGLLSGLLCRRLRAIIRQTPLTWAALSDIGYQHKKFPLYSTWVDLLRVISIQLPAMFFGFFFSPAIVGYYALAQRVRTLLMGMLGISIGQVFFAAAAQELQQTGTIAPIVRVFFKRLVQLSVFPLAVLGFFGAPLFGLVFGQPWTEAGVYAQILAGWSLLSFLTVPLNIFTLLNRQDLDFQFTLGGLAGRAIVLLIGAKLGQPRLALFLFGVFTVGFLTVYLGAMLRYAGVSLRWALRTLLGHLIISGALLLPIKILAWRVDDIRVMLGGLGLAAMLYGVLLLRREPVLQQTLRMHIARFREK